MSIFDEEKLSPEVAQQSSGYVIMRYEDAMETSEATVNEEIALLNRPAQKGQVDLVSEAEFNRMSEEFGGRVSGQVVTYGNLENVLTMVFEELKDEADFSDNYCKGKADVIEGFSSLEGKLKADHQTKENLDDLANKVFGFQEIVRDQQAASLREGRQL